MRRAGHAAISRVKRPARGRLRKTARRFGGHRKRARRLADRFFRSHHILRQPRTLFGVTVLRHDKFVRLKRDLHAARHPDEPLDLRGVAADPRHALYLADGRPFVIDIALSRCRGVGMDPCNLGSPQNPFTVALEDALTLGHVGFHENALSTYYRAVQPATAAHVIGLSDGSALARFPPWGTVLPWQRRTPAEQRDRCTTREQTESCTHGPVSDRKGREEIARLLSVYRSIERRGFVRELGEVTGSLLLSEEGWACHIIDGLHRIAAMQVLGHGRVPVRIITRGDLAPVRRSDVDAWPHVRSGLFSRTEALHVFDRLVGGWESSRAAHRPAVAACKAPAWATSTAVTVAGPSLSNTR